MKSTTLLPSYGSVSEVKNSETHYFGIISHENAVTAVYLFLWYVGCILYNIDNKMAVQMFDCPLTVGFFQISAGIPFIWIMWVTGFRKMPRLHSTQLFAKIVPAGLFHLVVHIGSIMAFWAGAVSFAQIVKAGEPVVTAAVSAAIVPTFAMSWQTWLTLVPIVGGVALASAQEFTFSWMSFSFAMLSNFGAAFKAVYAKRVLSNKDEIGTNLDSENVYGLLTIVSAIAMFPIVLLVEGRIVVPEITEALETYGTWPVFYHIAISGLWYYAYNEMAFVALGRVGQVTHAIANTVKRVSIVVISILIFNTQMSTIGAFGSAIAVGGTCAYALCKAKFDKTKTTNKLQLPTLTNQKFSDA
eukprot:Platyproteum_vivax@DN3399_c0_g1_i2.p1